MVALGLQNVQLLIAETIENIEQYIEHEGYQACVLFPAEEAQVLRAYQDDQQPLLLIVPDGTWRKAWKILHCNSALGGFAESHFTCRFKQPLRLRKAPNTQALATVEAVSYALYGAEPDADFSPLPNLLMH